MGRRWGDTTCGPADTGRLRVGELTRDSATRLTLPELFHDVVIDGGRETRDLDGDVVTERNGRVRGGGVNQE